MTEKQKDARERDWKKGKERKKWEKIKDREGKKRKASVIEEKEK